VLAFTFTGEVLGLDLDVVGWLLMTVGVIVVVAAAIRRARGSNERECVAALLTRLDVACRLSARIRQLRTVGRAASNTWLCTSPTVKGVARDTACRAAGQIGESGPRRSTDVRKGPVTGHRWLTSQGRTPVAAPGSR